MRRSHGQRRPARLLVRARGPTYVELVITLVMASVLMGAMMSAMLAVSQQETSTQQGLTGTRNYAEVIGRLVDELATAISQQDANHLQITVPDRDTDGTDEIISYQFQDGELVRAFNGGDPQSVADHLAEATFELDNASTSGGGDAQVQENVLLASFDGYSGGYSQSCSDASISTTKWLSEYVELAALADASSYDITSVSIRMSSDGGASGGTVTMSVHLAGAGSHAPLDPALDEASITFTESLPGSSTWYDFHVSGLTNLSAEDDTLCVLVKASISSLAQASYCKVWTDTGPDDGTELHWTYDAGRSWSPASYDWDKYDMRFYVYGNLYGGSGEMQEGPTLRCRGSSFN